MGSMFGTRMRGRLLGAFVIVTVLLCGGTVFTPAAEAAPPAAPWTSPPSIGSWVPLDTPRGSIDVKVVAPGLAVYPGELADGTIDVWTGMVPAPALPQARQEAFVARAEALIGFLQKTRNGAALLSWFGKLAPLPDESGSWVRPNSTFSSNGQAVAINNVMAISPTGTWGTHHRDAPSAISGEGSVSVLTVPETMEPVTHQQGSSTTQMLMPDATAFHEYVHALRGLAGYVANPLVHVPLVLPIDGVLFPHTAPLEEALTTGSPLLLMSARGYTIQADGTIALNTDTTVLNALTVASDREAALVRRYGPRPGGDFSSVTTGRLLSQGFTEYGYQVERGMDPRQGYSKIALPSALLDFGWKDTSVSAFIEALNGYTRADQTDPSNSRWLRRSDPPGGAACGSGSNATCLWSRGPSAPSATAAKARTDHDAAAAAGRPVVATPAGVPRLSPGQIDSMSVPDILAWARGQFDQTVRSHGGFGSLDDPGKTFIGLPETRNLLNRAHPDSSPAAGEGLDAMDYLDWLSSLKTAFGSDVSHLQTAATLTAMVPVLAESLGIAAAVEAGDKAAIAANAVSLLSTLLSVVITNPVVGTAVGMVAMLVVSFIYAATMPDPSPVAREHLKRHRDSAFADLIPRLATDFARVLSEGFALSQAQQLVALGVVDAGIDHKAELAAEKDPLSGAMLADEAQRAKQALHAQAQESLRVQRANLMAAAKTAFRELIATEVTDAETQQVITDTVLPLYSHAGQGYAWSDGKGTVTPGWVYFAAVAQQQGDYYCLHGRSAPWIPRTAADFAAGADLRDCSNVIYEMNTTFVPNVIALRSTALTAPPTATLDQAVDAALAVPDTAQNLTAATVPPPGTPARDRPWRITYPVPSPATPAAGGTTARAETDGLILGEGRAGHRIQVRDQDGDVYCTTDVNIYGTWGCRTSSLIAPGFTLTIWENDSDLGASATAPGTRLTITGPTGTPDPAASLDIRGTGTPGHDLVVTLHPPAADGQPATARSIHVGADSTWSCTIPANTLRPGSAYSVTAADKSIFDTRSISFTTTGAAPTPPPAPFEESYEAETCSTGGTTFTLPNGQRARRYAAGQEAAFTVTVPTPGTYTFELTYNATTRGGDTLVTAYPGTSSINAGRLQISTGTTRVTTTLTLPGGISNITLVPPPGAALPDIDKIRLSSAR